MKKFPEQGEPLSRRRFVRDAALAAMSAALLPEGLVPVVLAEDTSVIPEKPGLTLLNDRPVNAETPAHLLDEGDAHLEPGLGHDRHRVAELRHDGELGHVDLHIVTGVVFEETENGISQG